MAFTHTAHIHGNYYTLAGGGWMAMAMVLAFYLDCPTGASACVLANRPHKSMPFARSVIMLCAHTLTHTNTHIRACACVIWPDGPNTRERTYGRTHARTFARSVANALPRCFLVLHTTPINYV